MAKAGVVGQKFTKDPYGSGNPVSSFATASTGLGTNSWMKDKKEPTPTILSTMTATIANAILNVDSLKTKGLSGTGDVAGSIGIGTKKKKDNGLLGKLVSQGLKKAARFSSLLGLGMLILDVLAGGPLKAILKMITAIFQIVLLPIGMLLLILFKPAMIMLIKLSMNFMKSMIENKKLFLLFEGMGDLLAGMLGFLSIIPSILTYWFISLTLGLRKIVEKLPGLSNSTYGVSTEDLEKKQYDALVKVNDKRTEIDNYFTSGLMKIKTALSGPDGLVDQLSGTAPADAIAIFAGYVEETGVAKESTVKGVINSFSNGISTSGRSVTTSMNAFKDRINAITASMNSSGNGNTMSPSNYLNNEQTISYTWQSFTGEIIQSQYYPGPGWKFVK